MICLDFISSISYYFSTVFNNNRRGVQIDHCCTIANAIFNLRDSTVYAFFLDHSGKRERWDLRQLISHRIHLVHSIAHRAVSVNIIFDIFIIFDTK
jgi:hypothetical protein